MDGTLILGDEAIEGALDVVASARAAGLSVVFLTNTSGATRAQLADRLTRLGIAAEPHQVYTSAAAAATWLTAQERCAYASSRVAMLGNDGLRDELEARGLDVVRADADPGDEAGAIDAVVVGLDRAHDAALPEPLAPAVAARLAAGGVPLVACNRELTYPGSGHEVRPGCGRVVAAVEAQTAHAADVVVGKPHPNMLVQAAGDLGVSAAEVLVIGDSLVSDVGLARCCGSAWVYLRRDGAPAPDSEDDGCVITRLGDLVELFALGRCGDADGARGVHREAVEAPPQGDLRTRLDRSVDGVLPRALHRYREQVLYLVAGGWNTVFGYLVFVGLYWALHRSLPTAVILIMSWVVAVTNAYMWYRYLVFRSRGRMHREIPRFFLVYGVTLAANLIVLPVALRTLPLNVYVVQGLFMLVVMVVSYFGHRWFSFREGRAAAAGSAAAAPNGRAASSSGADDREV